MVTPRSSVSKKVSGTVIDLAESVLVGLGAWEDRNEQPMVAWFTTF